MPPQAIIYAFWKTGKLNGSPIAAPESRSQAEKPTGPAENFALRRLICPVISVESIV
jgi:hypothetical protein